MIHQIYFIPETNFIINFNFAPNFRINLNNIRVQFLILVVFLIKSRLEPIFSKFFAVNV